MKLNKLFILVLLTITTNNIFSIIYKYEEKNKIIYYNEESGIAVMHNNDDYIAYNITKEKKDRIYDLHSQNAINIFRALEYLYNKQGLEFLEKQLLQYFN